MAKDKKCCSVRKCGTPAYVRGWCVKHYTSVLRNGTPEPVKTKKPLPVKLPAAIVALLKKGGQLTLSDIAARVSSGFKADQIEGVLSDLVEKQSISIFRGYITVESSRYGVPRTSLRESNTYSINNPLATLMGRRVWDSAIFA